MKSLFFGGVHPNEHKDMSAAPLAAMPLPAQVVIPLRQHIGAPCRPLVAVGDTVRMGQKIGDGDGLCVPVHASVSGVVEAIEDRPHPGGGLCSIVIKNDFRDIPDHAMPPHSDISQFSPGELISIIHQAGLVGMGGAAFPTSVKSQTGVGQVDTVILNSCECEPYITADDMLLRTRPKDVLRGLSVLRRILSPRQAITGQGVKQPRNLTVRVGTSFQEVINAAGGLADDVWKVLSGGPMMGIAQRDLSVPVTKATNAILCLSSAQNGESPNPACIRCGKCLEVCPIRLEPLYLYRYSNAGNLDALKRLHLMDCIECGCCAYACPGKLPLVEGFRLGKRALKEGAK